MSGYVYAAHTTDKSVIKVGFSSFPERRVSTLRYDGKRFVAIGCLPGDMGVEAEITQRFSEFAMPTPFGSPSKDYFRWDDRIMEYLKSLPFAPIPRRSKADATDDSSEAIRVRVSTKRRIDEIQWSMKQETGRKTPLSEIIDQAMDLLDAARGASSPEATA